MPSMGGGAGGIPAPPPKLNSKYGKNKSTKPNSKKTTQPPRDTSQSPPPQSNPSADTAPKKSVVVSKLSSNKVASPLERVTEDTK